MKAHLLSAAACAALALALAGCAKQPGDLAGHTGGASEHGNALTGTVITPALRPAAFLPVVAYQKAYVPLTGYTGAAPDTVYTDSNGAFRFAGLKAGDYNVAAIESDSNRALFVAGVRLGNDSLLNLGARALSKTIALIGTAYDSLSGIKIDSSYVYLSGSPFFTQTDAQGAFRLTLPTGDYGFTVRPSLRTGLPATSVQALPVHVPADSDTTAARVRFPVKTAFETGNGLLGAYFLDTSLTRHILTRVDTTVDFLWWYYIGPDTLIPEDSFSVRWTGQVLADYDEDYTFYTYTDDGVRLWIDGVLQFDYWIRQYPTEYSVTVHLSAGTRHNIRMEYYELVSTGEARLFWSSPSTPKQIIPQTHLFH